MKACDEMLEHIDYESMVYEDEYWAHCYRAKCCYMLDYLQECIYSAEKAIRIYPYGVEPYIQEILTFQQAEQYEDAEHVMTQYREFRPESDAMDYYEALNLRAQEKPEEALKLLEKVEANYKADESDLPNYEDLLLELADLYDEANRNEEQAVTSRGAAERAGFRHSYHQRQSERWHHRHEHPAGHLSYQLPQLPLRTSDSLGRLRRAQRIHRHSAPPRKNDPEIAEFPNRMFYRREKLEPVPCPHQLETELSYTLPSEDALDDLLKEHRMIFLPSKFCKEPNVSDKINANEAAIVVDLLRRIHRFYRERFDAKKTVGVIVPYRNQIAMVRKGIEKLGIPELEKISIDTVERYQGSQRDVIIYSFTIQNIWQLDFLAGNSFVEDGAIIDRKPERSHHPCPESR